VIWPISWTLIALVLALGFTWWLSRRINASHAPVALMVTRIELPADLRIADPQAALARLQLRDEIVIPFPKATLVIEFPLTHPAHVAIAADLPQGFTRGEIVQTICDEYAHVYAAEEGTSSGDVGVEDRAGGPERARSDGAYGIWGHPLEHLVLRSVRWVKQSNGDVRVEPFVDAKPLPPPTPPRELAAE
jgi:hypothetical protein